MVTMNDFKTLGTKIINAQNTLQMLSERRKTNNILKQITYWEGKLEKLKSDLKSTGKDPIWLVIGEDKKGANIFIYYSSVEIELAKLLFRIEHGSFNIASIQKVNNY